MPQGRARSSADEELIRTDPQLPGLRALLSGDAALELLDSLLAAQQERPSWVEVVRGHYRRGTSFTATLVLHYADEPRYAFARAFPPEAAAEAAAEITYARQWTPPSNRSTGLLALADPRLRGPLYAPDLGIVLGPPADDRALPALRRLITEPQRSTGLTELSPRTFSYRAGHHWIGQLTDNAGQPRLMVHTRSSGVNAACYLGPALAGLPVPDLVKVSRYGLLVTQWLSGRPVSYLGGPERQDVLGQTGRLLTRLHAAAPPRELPHRDPVASLSHAVTQISTLLPRLAPRAAAVAQTVATALAQTEAPQAFVHGSLTPARIIAGERGPALVGLEEAHCGHPATDLAWYAASCYATQPHRAYPTPLCDPLLASYLDALPSLTAKHVRRDLDVFMAAALLHQAAVPFRRGVPDWDVRATALVAAAETVLEER